MNLAPLVGVVNLAPLVGVVNQAPPVGVVNQAPPFGPVNLATDGKPGNSWTNHVSGAQQRKTNPGVCGRTFGFGCSAANFIALFTVGRCHRTAACLASNMFVVCCTVQHTHKNPQARLKNQLQVCAQCRSPESITLRATLSAKLFSTREE